MPPQAWVTLGLLTVLFALLIWDRLPVWLVFMGTLTAAMTLKLAPAQALLNGFSNPAVLTIAALFPVAAGMYATGAISLLSQRIIGRPKTLMSAQLRIFAPTALASAFLNNTPLVAMMIPVVRDLTRATGLPASKLFMGLSFASILGGCMSLIGASSNLVVAGLVADAAASGRFAGVKPLSMFAPIGLGLPATLVGLLFMITIGARLLPVGKRPANRSGEKRIFRTEFKVEADSPLDGRTLEEAGFADPEGYTLLSISRAGMDVEQKPNFVLRAGDVLSIAAPAEVLPLLWSTIGLMPLHGSHASQPRFRRQLVEVVVSSKSPAVGRLISELPLPDSPYAAAIVAASHEGRAPEVPLREYRVQVGDGGILEVDDAFLYENRLERDFILTKIIDEFRVQRVERAWTASAITVLMIVSAALGITTLLDAALLATMAMLLTGCLDAERAWRSIDWKTLVILGVSIGLESAVTGSGLSQEIAELCARLGGASPTLSLAVVLAGSIIMTNVITNAAAAAFMFPVALSLAQALKVSFLPFAVILIVGASCSFINPAGFLTNLMVQEPGRYTFADFAKVGAPLTLIVGAIVILLAPVVYGF